MDQRVSPAERFCEADPSAGFSSVNPEPDSPSDSASKVAARLRQYRKARNKTLRELALALGTTPQTVARLETGRTTISLEWLFKFCAELEVDPVTLLQGNADAVPILGTVGRTKTVEYIPRDNQMPVALAPYSRGQLAVRLSTDLAHFNKGDILIACPVDHLSGEDGDWGHCLVSSAEHSALRLMHVFQDKNGDWILISPDQDGEIELADRITWLAQVVSLVRYVAASADHKSR